MSHDFYLVQAADRRHARVHFSLPTSDGQVCQTCLIETQRAARDLKIDELWAAMDSLYEGIVRSRP